MKVRIETGSPTLQRHIERLRKSYPHLPQDLESALQRIAEQPENAFHARQLPGFGLPIWKYRMPSTDLKRGQCGSFRLLAVFRHGDEVLHPFALYSKTEYDVPPREDMRHWLKDALGLPSKKEGPPEGRP